MAGETKAAANGAAADAEPASEHKETHQKVTPWEVQSEDTIDYGALIRDFGTTQIDDELLKRFRKVTGRTLHPLLARGIYFSHRELDKLLDHYEKGEPFYLYTGRGPSSGSMHIGHMIPFMFTQYLQEVFNCPLVIQLTDDEKFLWKSLGFEEARRLARENAKDIIAFGFDVRKTFIFQDTEYIKQLYPNICKFQKKTTFNQAKGAFGFVGSSNIGQVSFCAIQAVPSFSSTFKKLFGGRKMRCLIPCAIDQDPYFRVTRHVADVEEFGEFKPYLIHCKFVSGLKGAGTKMSASITSSAIFLDDTPDQVRTKIGSSKSGGARSLEDHRAKGADLTNDVAYEYLKYFMDDDEKLGKVGKNQEKRTFKEIEEEYGAVNKVYKEDRINSKQVKDILIELLNERILKNIQKNRIQITEETVDAFMAVRELDLTM